MKNLILRPEIPSQYHAMEALVRDAFWDRFRPGCAEHLVVRNMREAPETVPELCLAAEEEGELVGGIWYARATLRDGETLHPVLSLGPVCVKPDRHSEGIGSALIRQSLSALPEGFPAVILYGDPAYYGRFGFRPASEFGITDAEGNPCPALLVRPTGEHVPCGAFDEGSVYHVTPEAVRNFDRQFPPRRMHYRSGQLFFVEPALPPEEPLLRTSWELRGRAETVLRDSGVLEAWESIGGEICGVGSFRTGLMMKKRDIDLHIYTETLDAERTLRALTPVIASGRTVGLIYANGAGTEEHCLEWHLRLADDSGEEWTIDMIQILAGTKYEGVMEDVAEAVIDAATPEIRKRILVLNNACPDGVKICGIEYCKAVIDDRVTSWPEFMAWRENNPPDSLMDWKPGKR